MVRTLSSKADREGGYPRTPALLTKKLMQLFVPNVCCSVAASLAVIADSIFAGVFIGTEALGAVALCTPYLYLDEMLHCLFGIGITTMITQAVGRGDRLTSRRIAGAVLVAVFAAYVVVLTPLYFLCKSVFPLFSTDELLFGQAVDYLRPMLISMPFFEVMLCLERTYVIDGRPLLFASRAVVANTLNIAFDYLFVYVMGLGIEGLAYATILSTLIGYAVTLSHGLSKRCTIRPDFSVWRRPREALGYIREDIVIGGSSAIVMGLYGLLVSVICKLIGTAGGTIGLAVWGVYQSIVKFFNAFSNGAGRGVSLLTGVLYGERDYEGLRVVMRVSAVRALVICALFIILVWFGGAAIAQVCGIAEEEQAFCASFLRVLCPAFPALIFGVLINVYFLNIGQIRRAYLFAIAEKLIVFAGVLGGSLLGLYGVLGGYTAAYALVFALYVFSLVRNGYWYLPPRDPGAIASHSLKLSKEGVKGLSTAVEEDLKGRGLTPASAALVALVVRELCLNTLSENAAHGRHPNVDLRFCIEEGCFVLSLTDNGRPFNAAAALASREGARERDEELRTLHGVETSLTYDRMLDLNYLLLRVRKTSGEQLS